MRRLRGTDSLGTVVPAVEGQVGLRGQLEGELARQNWFITPEEPKLIFDDDRNNLWDEAMARRTREL